jgi:hypothetical protein
MGARYFTVADANAMLPWLEGAIGRVVQLRAQLRLAADRLQALGQPITDESLSHEGGPPEVARARARANGLLSALADELAALDESGVEIKDLESGLCDFITRREGREVYLCWRLGEKEVGHWHELTAGFAGRRPLEVAAPRLLH